jgi:ribosomal protein S18 acetylase RimI-like enzyme
MTYRITDCRTFEPQALCAAMNAAFSDYVIPLNLSVGQFEEFQLQRGFSAAQSFVALADDGIAAFWFSGMPMAAYGNRAYTLSVGTHPGHRRKGLSRRLLGAVLETQRDLGAAGLQLEVITDNRQAITAYEAFGFRRQRRLGVLKLDALPAPGVETHATRPIGLGDLPDLEDDYFDTLPSPQNSRAALQALGSAVHLVAVVRDGELSGWGAAYPDGAIAQIGVRKPDRRQGLGSAILHALWQAVGRKELTFVNVDTDATGVYAFLRKAGAREVLQQDEMRLDLD